MKLIDCPGIGPRPIGECVYGGPLLKEPDPAVATDADWAGYVFHGSVVASAQPEWWFHRPSGTWFVAERDTTRDLILTTYLYRPGHADDEGGDG